MARRSAELDAAVARRRLSRLTAELGAARGTTDGATEARADGRTEEAPDHDDGFGPTDQPPVLFDRTDVPDRRTGVRPVPAHRSTPGRTGRLAALLTGGDRWPVRPQHVTVVALVAALAIALASWWALRSRPEQVAPPPIRATVSPAATSSVPPAAPESAPAGSVASAVGQDATANAGASDQELVVHVAGKVVRPGIVRLPPGSRVVDALRAARGARRGVDLSTLNLARPLVDGEQIAVGVPAAAAPPPPAGATVPGSDDGGSGQVTPAAPINLNTADATELDRLPGVGPVTADAILQWRSEHGGFNSVDELIEVSGIGEKTLADLRDLVTV